jgi:hypothetical protein
LKKIQGKKKEKIRELEIAREKYYQQQKAAGKLTTPPEQPTTNTIFGATDDIPILF